MSLTDALLRIRSIAERFLFMHRIYARTFGGGDGPLVLQDLSRRFGGSRSSAVFNSTGQTYYQEGQRSVVLYIHKKMRLSEEQRAALVIGDSEVDPLQIGESE